MSRMDLQPTLECVDAKNDPVDSVADGLSATLKARLDNPVLHSDFALPVGSSGAKRKWEFLTRPPQPFAKAWRPGWSRLNKLNV